MKLQAGAMVALLSDLLKVIYSDQGPDHGIHRISAVRNQLAGKQGKCFAGFMAQEPRDRNSPFFEGIQIYGVAIILFDGLVTIFPATYEAVTAEITLKISV